MLKFDNYCWFLRASKPIACTCVDNICSKLTTPALVISSGFSITSFKIAQMHTAVSTNQFHLQIYAISETTQNQPTQVSESMI